MSLKVRLRHSCGHKGTFPDFPVACFNETLKEKSCIEVSFVRDLHPAAESQADPERTKRRDQSVITLTNPLFRYLLFKMAQTYRILHLNG